MEKLGRTDKMPPTKEMLNEDKKMKRMCIPFVSQSEFIERGLIPMECLHDGNANIYTCTHNMIFCFCIYFGQSLKWN